MLSEKIRTFSASVTSRFNSLTKQQRALAIVAGVVVLAIIGYLIFRPSPPPPDDTTFSGDGVTFIYPRVLALEEYTRGAIALGSTTDAGDFVPLVNVVEYRTDPDFARPASFETFAGRQAAALCGSDDSVESITCSAPMFEPYTSTGGEAGQRIDLTLTRRNLTSGTTTEETFGPIYVFDTTQPPAEGDRAYWSGIFIYPDVRAVISGFDPSELLQKMMDSLVIE